MSSASPVALSPSPCSASSRCLAPKVDGAGPELRELPYGLEPEPESDLEPDLEIEIEPEPPRAQDQAGDELETDLTGVLIAGRYLVETLIASGRMGRVYRGLQVPLQRPVAIKVMNCGGPMADPLFARRFHLEASIASRLTHPHIVRVFDYGTMADGRPYLVMEYLEGVALSSLLEKEGKLAPTRVLAIAMQLARALRKAHGMSVIHRDLKPANIVIRRDEEGGDMLRVLDFGLVKLLGHEGFPDEEQIHAVSPNGSKIHVSDPVTAVGTLLGTPAYMAPEQALGGPVDGRTDLYAFGVVVFEMLSGRLPFYGASTAEVLRAHLSAPVPRLPVPEDEASCFLAVRKVAERCLEKEPDDRYPSSEELVRELQTIWRVELEESYGPRTSEVPLDGDLVLDLLGDRQMPARSRVASGEERPLVELRSDRASPIVATHLVTRVRERLQIPDLVEPECRDPELLTCECSSGNIQGGSDRSAFELSGASVRDPHPCSVSIAAYDPRREGSKRRSAQTCDEVDAPATKFSVRAAAALAVALLLGALGGVLSVRSSTPAPRFDVPPSSGRDVERAGLGAAPSDPARLPESPAPSEGRERLERPEEGLRGAEAPASASASAPSEQAEVFEASDRYKENPY